MYCVFDPAKVLICISCWATWTFCITMLRGAGFLCEMNMCHFFSSLVIIQFWSKRPRLFGVRLRDLPAAVFPIFEAQQTNELQRCICSVRFGSAWLSRYVQLYTSHESCETQIIVARWAKWSGSMTTNTDSGEFWWILTCSGERFWPVLMNVAFLHLPHLWIMGRMDYASSRAGLGPLLKGLSAQWISGSVGFGQNSKTFGLQLWGGAAVWIVAKCNPNVIRMYLNWRFGKPEAVYLRRTSSGHRQTLQFNPGHIWAECLILRYPEISSNIHDITFYMKSGLRQRRWGRWVSWLDDTRWFRLCPRSLQSTKNTQVFYHLLKPPTNSTGTWQWRSSRIFRPQTAMSSVHRCSMMAAMMAWRSWGESWLWRHAINNSNISTERCRSVLQLLWFSFSIGISMARSLTGSFPLRW